MKQMKDASIPGLLWKLSPPVMLALLIQSVYNIVDSYFVASYSPDGLTALSLIYPVQLLMTALATGTGTGMNILISRMDGSGNVDGQRSVIKSGLFLGVVNFIAVALVGLLCIRGYFQMSSGQLEVQAQGIAYARIIFLFSFGQFIEANCTKVLQAKGNMVLPMIAQVTGAVINVVLDWVLIFGKFGFPQLGIEGAAIATVIGQCAAMGIVLWAMLREYPLKSGKKGRIQVRWPWRIYKAGLPSILMQSLYTLYIVGLNLILKQFTEDAVTVLGLYYKLQTFFFIPLMGLQQVIVPVISFNHGAGNAQRVRETLKISLIISCGVMVIGTAVFMLVPEGLLSIFSNKAAVLEIGSHALRVISVSFIPAAVSMMLTVYFQGIMRGMTSIFITVLRQVFLLVPLAWVFHFWGLSYVWLTFPVTEVIAASCCVFLARKENLKNKKNIENNARFYTPESYSL